KQAGISNCFDNVYDQQGPDYFLKEVKRYFEGDDLTLVNLEGTISSLGEPDPNKKWRFRGDPEYLQILTGSSVEAVSFSNNHCRDYGEESYTDTMKNLEEAGILYSSEDITAVTTVKGIKIGMLAVNSAFRAGDNANNKEYPNTRELMDIIQACIDELKEQEVQLIIASLHFGVESTSQVTSQQKQLAHFAIDQGADLVIGHHPHVLQGTEYYNGAYIAYSLGNFCFGGNTNPKNRDTVIWQQEFTFTDGAKTGQSVKLVPCLISSPKGRNNYQPITATGSAATRILGKMRRYSSAMGVTVGSDGTLTVK
ncbi:MAG: CapA family protein, partial [Lachnospiraceae bacterium]|nr:CapA family protein [Lachnospiraceae bacterium]